MPLSVQSCVIYLTQGVCENTKVWTCELVWKTYKVDSKLDSDPSESSNVDLSFRV
jgi:hypothetical protein